jgi:hypothetical protein
LSWKAGSINLTLTFWLVLKLPALVVQLVGGAL